MAENSKVETPKDVTVLLAKWGEGDREALDALTPLVYNELRKLAKSYLRRERVGHTLEGTALVHEAYLRLIDQREVEWRNRNHFFALAAELIRRILVDHARARIAAKRGGNNIKLSLDESITPVDEKDLDLLALNDALDTLARTDAQQSRIVELRYFAGLTIEETADVLQISTATVKRDWVMAQAFLKREMLRHVSV